MNVKKYETDFLKSMSKGSCEDCALYKKNFAKYPRDIYVMTGEGSTPCSGLEGANISNIDIATIQSSNISLCGEYLDFEKMERRIKTHRRIEEIMKEPIDPRHTRLDRRIEMPEPRHTGGITICVPIRSSGGLASCVSPRDVELVAEIRKRRLMTRGFTTRSTGGISPCRKYNGTGGIRSCDY